MGGKIPVYQKNLFPAQCGLQTLTKSPSDAEEHLTSLNHLRSQLAKIHLLTLLIHATFLRFSHSSL